jgi:hypothetical protein
VIGWFASHPDTGVRIERLEKEIASLQAQPQPTANPNPHPTATPGPTVVVVLDPEASDSYGYGFGRGYYYAEDLSSVAKQETEVALEKKGFKVLVSTQDVGPLQEELELENSEWGQYGEHRQPIGYFSGAQQTFYVSAYVAGEQGYDVGDWRRQARVEGLKVGVLLRQIDLKTRRQVQSLRGTGSAAALSRARVSLGRDWDPVEVELERIDNLARRAVGEAVGKALTSVSSYASASTSPAPTPATATVTIRLWEADKRTPATDTVLLKTSRGERKVKVDGRLTVEVEPGSVAIRARVRPGFTQDNPGWELSPGQKPEVVAQPGQVVIWDLYKVSR